MSDQLAASAQLTFDEAHHRYTLGGRPIPSVTTILSALPKPGLPYWAARRVAEDAAARAADLADLVTVRGTQAVIDDLKQAPWRERNQAAVRGTQVHALAEQVVRGEPASMSDDQAALVRPYVEWLDAHDVRPLLTETMVANRDHWYAGRLDLVAQVDGDTWLLDLKTSRGVWGSFALQTAAYAHAQSFGDRDMPPIQHLGIVHLQPGHTTLHEVPDPDRAFTIFEDVLRMWHDLPTIKEWDSND